MLNREEFLLSKYKENVFEKNDMNPLLNTPKQMSLKEYAQKLSLYNDSIKKSDKNVKFSNINLNHSPKPKILKNDLYFSNQIKNPEFDYFKSPIKPMNLIKYSNTLKPENKINHSYIPNNNLNTPIKPENLRLYSNNLKPEDKISRSYVPNNNINNNFTNSFKISNAFTKNDINNIEKSYKVTHTFANNNNIEKSRKIYSQKTIEEPRQLYSQKLISNPIDINKDNILKNIINELKAQINSKNIQISNLDNENKNLKRNCLNSDLLKTKLDEEINKHKIMAQQNIINDGTIKRLQEEILRINKRNEDFQNQINELVRKNPGVYHYDYGTEKVISEKEYKLQKEIENFENKIGLLQKEKDKLFLENYELKKIYKIDLPNLDETVEEIYQMQYENNLQMADLTIKNLKRKLENSEEQKEILNNELNILRSLDIKDNKELLGKIKRNIKNANKYDNSIKT